jgi:hypothetical protein
MTFEETIGRPSRNNPLLETLLWRSFAVEPYQKGAAQF